MLFHGNQGVSRTGSVLQPFSGISCESRSIVCSSREDCPQQAASSLLVSLHPHGYLSELISGSLLLDERLPKTDQRCYGENDGPGG